MCIFSSRCIFHFFKDVIFSGFVMLVRARVPHIGNHKIEEEHQRKGSFQKKNCIIIAFYQPGYSLPLSLMCDVKNERLEWGKIEL